MNFNCRGIRIGEAAAAKALSSWELLIFLLNKYIAQKCLHEGGNIWKPEILYSLGWVSQTVYES